MGSVKRFTQRLYDTPQLATQSLMDQVLDYLEHNRTLEIELPKKEAFFDREEQLSSDVITAPHLTIENGVAMFNLTGTTMYQASMLDAMCMDLVSYTGVTDAIRTLKKNKDKVELIVGYVDSGGGEAKGCFETGEELRKAFEELNVPSIAYVNGLSCSAGYALTSAFGEIVSNPDSEIGSIGVRVALSNYSKMEKSMGIERTYITAGKSKVPFENDGSFRQEFLDSIQESVDATYDRFVSYVSDMRGMSDKDIRATEADTYRAEIAHEVIGLVDQVMTRQEFEEYISSIVPEFESPTFEKLFNVISTKQLSKEESMNINEMLETEEAKQALSAQVEAALEAKQAELASQFEAEKEKLTKELADKEALLLAKEEAAEQAKKDAKLATIMEQVEQLSFVQDEQREELAEFLLANESNATVFEVLTQAQEAVESVVTEQLSEESEDKETELTSPQEAESGLMKSIKAQKEKAKSKKL